MAIALTGTPASGYVGPGYLCGVTGLTAPSGLDDLAFVNIEGPAGGHICGSSGRVNPSGTALVQFGVYFSGVHPVIAPLEFKALGDAVSIAVYHYDGGGSLVENVVVAGFLYEPSGGSWALQGLLLDRIATITSDSRLDLILSRVSNDLPSLP